MPFRAYNAADRDGCLAVYDSNAGRFFSPGDRDDLLRFLAAPSGAYGVLTDEAGQIVGCGGVAADRQDARTAVLTWGMVRADRHGRGLGRLLLLARLRLALELPNVARVVCHTSQLTAGFYRKYGFRDVRILADGYGKGLDRHDMELGVDHALRSRLAAEVGVPALLKM